MIPITGGKVTGPSLSGDILAGGADWAIIHDDGTVTVDARYAIRATDGTIIQVLNGVISKMDRATTPRTPLLTIPRFTAPEGPHDWLNQGVYVGVLMADSLAETGGVKVDMFKMVSTSTALGTCRLAQPKGLVSQSRR
jgi:Protein of unknown function (DUF3237)